MDAESIHFHRNSPPRQNRNNIHHLYLCKYDVVRYLDEDIHMLRLAAAYTIQELYSRIIAQPRKVLVENV